MTEWLDNNFIDEMQGVILHRSESVFRSGSDNEVREICAQAKEANRLRAGMEGLAQSFESESQETWRAQANRLARSVLAKRIRELLEGGE